jgi:hypothetical protein
MNTGKHPRKTAAANKAGKPKAQMNAVPSSGKELIVDSLGPLDPDALRADRAFRLHLDGRSIREIADLLGCSTGKAWQSVAKMSEALRDISTPEHRGAVRELLVRRYGKIYRQAEQCLNDAIEGLDRGAVPALIACLLKVNSDLARLYALDGDSGAAGVPAVGRLEEVARRIMLSGPHSKAARLQALRLADVTPQGETP